MEHEYILKQATSENFTRIWEIIQQAKAQMYKEGRQQWDESYPTHDHILTDIHNGYAYILCNGQNIIAFAALIFDEEPTYQSIQGKWLSNLPYVVVHRLAVANEMKHCGIATLFMKEVEKMSIAKGVHSFKVDTNFDNFGMQKVLDKCGFTYCGEIIFQGGTRIAYEKLL